MTDERWSDLDGIRVSYTAPCEPVEDCGYLSHCIAITHGDNAKNNAAFIAACDPTTILALVEVAKAAKAWGDADTDDAVATLESELILCNAILALQKIAQPEPGQQE